MIFDELPSSWRFVDDEKKLTKNRSCDQCNELSPIVCTISTVLPSFIWRTQGIFFNVLTFDLTEDGGGVIDMSAYIPDIKIFVIDGYTYLAFNKTTISPQLAPGTYQATISDLRTTIYSEPINVCDDVTRCVQFDWTNTCDLAGVPYAYLETIFGTQFLNTYSVKDMSLISAEYETEQEKLENALRQTDVFYLNQTRTFSLKNPSIPDWFVRVLQVMKLHSDITITYDIDNNHQNGLYTTTAEECSVTSALAENNCSASIEIKVRQDDAIISTMCCVNKEPEPCLESCYDVIGFKDDVTPSTGDFAIDDVDSGLIYEWSGSTWVLESGDCTYVHNTANDTYLFYDGDVWNITPNISSVSTVLVQANFTTLQLFGYSMPGTFVYVGSSSFEGGCNYEAVAYSAEDLASGMIEIVVDTNTYYYICIKSVSHGCEYGVRQIHFDL